MNVSWRLLVDILMKMREGVGMFEKVRDHYGVNIIFFRITLNLINYVLSKNLIISTAIQYYLFKSAP